MTAHEIVPASNFRLNRIKLVSRAAKWICLAVMIYDLGFFLLRTLYQSLFRGQPFHPHNLAVLILGMVLAQAGIWFWYRKMVRLPAFRDHSKLIAMIIFVQIVLWVGFWNLGNFPALNRTLPKNDEIWFSSFNRALVMEENQWYWLLRTFIELVMVFWFWKLGRLFRYYEQGIIFSSAPIRCIKILGLVCIVGWTLETTAKFLPFQSVRPVPVFTPPPGAMVVPTSPHIHYMGFFDFDLGSGINFGPFVIGIIIVLVAWIMEEGRKIQEEQELTV